MTFLAQVRRAFRAGLALAALGLALGLAAVLLEAGGLHGMGQVAAWLSVLMIAAGAMWGLAGGVARPIQRWGFLHGAPSGRLRAFVLRQPTLRWWYWVDEAGRERDD